MTDIDHAIVILYNVYRGPTHCGKYLNGTHDAEGKPNRAFIQKRFPLFLDSTMRSLVNQRSRNFFVVFMYANGSEFGSRLDIFKKQCRTRLDVGVEYAPIPPIDFRTPHGYRRNFWARRPSEEAAVRAGSQGRKWIYITYLDGDDFLRDDYVERVQQISCSSDTQAIVCRHGYAFDTVENRLRHFDRGKCPPFFTLRYRAQDFLKGKRWDGGPGRHLFVDECLKSVFVNERVFAQHIHEENDSTAFNMPGGGSELADPTRSRLLRRFGWPAGGHPHQPVSGKPAPLTLRG